ncbi:MAG: hypothetical protein ACFBZ8_10700 [Opitutales bacterium]
MPLQRPSPGFYYAGGNDSAWNRAFMQYNFGLQAANRVLATSAESHPVIRRLNTSICNLDGQRDLAGGSITLDNGYRNTFTGFQPSVSTHSVGFSLVNRPSTPRRTDCPYVDMGLLEVVETQFTVGPTFFGFERVEFETVVSSYVYSGSDVFNDPAFTFGSLISETASTVPEPASIAVIFGSICLGFAGCTRLRLRR